MTDDKAITGGCNCGAIRYTLAAPPLAVAACHCTSCRRQSGATYSVNLVVRADSMAVEGNLASWDDHDTESGKPVSRQFCGTCGSPIRSVLGSNPAILAVKAGTLDDPGPFPPGVHVWTESRIGWVAIPEGVPQLERSTA